MKICISSTGENTEADVDQRFGRCRFFLIVDMETKTVKTVPNESGLASGGAGIQAAQTVLKEGVGSVITGNIGPNAFQILHAAGIKVFTGAEGTIKDILQKYAEGALSETGKPTQESHFGLGGRA